MGFMSEGGTLSWKDTAKVADYIRKHGIIQFLNIYKEKKDAHRDQFKWGDEVEFVIVHYDHERRRVLLSLRSHEILPILQTQEHQDPDNAAVLWRPEYGSFMIEATPGGPFCQNPDIFALEVEANMRLRRRLVADCMLPNDAALTIGGFPMMGMGMNVIPAVDQPGGSASESLFTPDAVINHHPRFSTLTDNIRERRGSRVDINVPLFRDSKTQAFPVHPDRWPSELPGPSPHTPEPWIIHMDSMAFGMGMCCLQSTFQCCNITEARLFYDQLGCLAPVMLALSAASPIYRGFLSDIDARWTVIAQSVDDRTPEERGEIPAVLSPRTHHREIPKSRYDSISTYLCGDSKWDSAYNDVELIINEEIYQQLRDNGIDHLLAQHLAHLFVRDPLVVYGDRVEIDDEKNPDHFENIQSTNWQTVRFKPPPPGSNIGWRVEFRPIEVQMTDFENAAFVVFIVLLTRAILTFDLNFYLPISKVDANMRVAHHRDALNKEKFWFRRKITATCGSHTSVDDHEEMTINEIINGKNSCAHPGLIQVIRIYLDSIQVNGTARQRIEEYLTFLSKRARGELITPATWIRNYVTTHPAYKQDSIVTNEIAYDLLRAMQAVSEGRREAPDLLGDVVIPSDDGLDDRLTEKQKAQWREEREKLAELLAANLGNREKGVKAKERELLKKELEIRKKEKDVQGLEKSHH